MPHFSTTLRGRVLLLLTTAFLSLLLTGSARAGTYSDLIKSDGPSVHYQMDDPVSSAVATDSAESGSRQRQQPISITLHEFTRSPV